MQVIKGDGEERELSISALAAPCGFSFAGSGRVIEK